MENTGHILRKKMEDRGEIVMSEEELGRYRATDLAGRKKIMADLQRRSGMFTGRYCNLADYDVMLNKVEGSFPKDMQTGKKAKK